MVSSDRKIVVVVSTVVALYLFLHYLITVSTSYDPRASELPQPKSVPEVFKEAKRQSVVLTNSEKESWKKLLSIDKTSEASEKESEDEGEEEEENSEFPEYSDEQVISSLVKTPIKYNIKTSPWINRPTDLPARFRDCYYDKCTLTKDYTKADLVVFTGRALLTHPIQEFWPRRWSQRWIFHTVDPVISNFGLNNDSVKSMFNWTATYKVDSDVPIFLGKIQRRQIPLPPVNYGKIFRQKTKMAAWFVSHCETWSKREEYVERMNKIAQVDIFGGCGTKKCGSNHGALMADLNECFPILTKEYKFYLSFENTFCTDYVTEKIFRMFVDVKVIPVTRGGVDYKSAFPKGTFVDAADFDTPEELAEYLVELGNDEERYTSMLAEKDRWEMTEHKAVSPWCEYCKKLHTDDTVGHYEDISQVLRKDPNECWAPQDLGPKYIKQGIRSLIEESSQYKRIVEKYGEGP